MRTPARRTLSASLKTALRVAISAGIVAILVRKFGGNIVSRLMSADLGWVLGAVAAFSFGQIASSMRFVWALQALGRRIPLGFSVRVHYVGLWFNQVLPTSMGGDFVKALMLRPRYGTSRAVRVTLLDRLSGYLFLALMLGLTAPLYFDRFDGPYVGWFACAVAAATGLGTVAAVTAARSPSVRRWAPRHLRPLLLFALDIPRFLGRKYLLRQVVSSAAVHFAGIVSFWALANALGIRVPFLDHLLLVPLIFLVALLPVSFAGWGLRESGAIGLYGLIGIPPAEALAVSLLFGIVLVVASAPGGLLWMVPDTQADASPAGAGRNRNRHVPR